MKVHWKYSYKRGRWMVVGVWDEESARAIANMNRAIANMKNQSLGCLGYQPYPLGPALGGFAQSATAAFTYPLGGISIGGMGSMANASLSRGGRDE